MYTCVMNESLLGTRMMCLMLSRNYDKVDDFGDVSGVSCSLPIPFKGHQQAK